MRLTTVLVALSAAVACASGGTYMPPGTYGAANAANLSDVIFFTADKGPPRTITSGSVVLTWDEESGSYREPPPGCDNWTFDGLGHLVQEDWPTPPLLGPPTTTMRLVF